MRSSSSPDTQHAALAIAIRSRSWRSAVYDAQFTAQSCGGERSDAEHGDNTDGGAQELEQHSDQSTPGSGHS